MKTLLPLSLSSRSRRIFALTLVLAAPVAAVQLSGCGGGGGGGGGGINIPPTLVTATFQLVDENGNNADGTVTLRQGSVDIRTQQSVNQEAVFTNIPSGTYTVVFTINGVTTSSSVSIATDANQTFQLTSGQDESNPQGITISGKVQLNPVTGNTQQCTDTTQGITARLIIRVRDANQSDRPIVASIEKPRQSGANVPVSQQGNFRVPNIPGPGTYVVEVVSAKATAADPSPGQFTGRSPAVTLAPGQTSVSGLRICANAGTFAPGDVP